MKKVFKIAHIRQLERQISNGEITTGRMAEVLNEMAFEAYRDIACDCQSRSGETSVMCCNHCGKPTEDFWTQNKTQQ